MGVAINPVLHPLILRVPSLLHPTLLSPTVLSVIQRIPHWHAALQATSSVHEMGTLLLQMASLNLFSKEQRPLDWNRTHHGWEILALVSQ